MHGRRVLAKKDTLWSNGRDKQICARITNVSLQGHVCISHCSALVRRMGLPPDVAGVIFIILLLVTSQNKSNTHPQALAVSMPPHPNNTQADNHDRPQNGKDEDDP